MNWLERLGLGLLILIALVVGIGFTLPSNFKVVRTIEVNQSVDKVYPLIADLKQWRSWGVWYERDPKMTTDYSGTPFEVGHKVAWKSVTQGDGEMTLIAVEPNRSVTYSLYFPDFEMASTGKMTLISNDNNGTTIEWSDVGDVGSDILDRYFILFIDGMIGPDFEAGLSNLKALAEQAN